jgi:nucleoside-diphosphate-sugar epimerase
LSDWTGQRVLLTGATGFIGCRLAEKLVAAGAELWAGVYPGDPEELLKRLPAKCIQVPIDLGDGNTVRQAVRTSRPDTIFHLAATGVTNPGIAAPDALKVNTTGAICLLEALRKHHPQRIILVGTCHEYGARESMEGLDPINFYAASKIATWAFARAYWRAHQLPVVTVRLFQVYGPGQPAQTLIPSAIRAARAGDDFPMTPGDQQRDFIAVADVVEGMMAAAQAPDIEGSSIDLGTGTAHSIRAVVERIWQLTGAQGHILPGALPYRPSVAMRLVADAQRTATLTGWRARISLDEGIRQTIDEF